jgi:hypothetical protein
VSWPTISTTVGHLEERWSLISVGVVGLIAATAFQALVYRNPRTDRNRSVLPAPITVLEITPQDVPLSQGRALPIDSSELKPFRFYTWYVGLFVASIGVFAGFVVAHATDDKYWRGYLIYGAFLVAGVAIPSFLIRVHREGQFPTAFFTFRSLRADFPPVATLLIAGLTILTLHLALYPWPSIGFEPKQYAGLKAGEARAKAEKEIERIGVQSRLSYTGQIRGIEGGLQAWVVLFSPTTSSSSDSGCVVVVTDKSVNAKPECSS